MEGKDNLGLDFSFRSLESSYLPRMFEEGQSEKKEPGESTVKMPTLLDRLGHSASSLDSKKVASIADPINTVCDNDSFNGHLDRNGWDPSVGTHPNKISVIGSTDTSTTTSPEKRGSNTSSSSSSGRKVSLESSKSVPFWQRVAERNSVPNNRVGAAAVIDVGAQNDARRDSADRFKSAKQVRHMRKKVSVTSQPGGSRTNKDHLALAAVEGSLVKVQAVVDAYVALYGASEGFNTVMGFRYDIDPRTFVITSSTVYERENGNFPKETPKEEMYCGLSALHLACVFDQEQVLAYFFRYGLATCLNTMSSTGQTLAHTCAWFGTAAPLTLLIQTGVRTSVPNTRGHTPLHLAALCGHQHCMRLLLKAGCDAESRDAQGNSPLHAAVVGGHFSCAQELLNYDDIVDVNGVNVDGGTPLHYCSSVAMVGLLLANAADPNVEMKGSKSAFDVFLETMPEGCNMVLNNYLQSNGKSLGASDLELAFNYGIFYQDFDRHRDEGETRTLSAIVEAEQRDILKHPVCESFMHLKWLLVRKFFRVYIVLYTLFLTAITGLVFIELSPMIRKLEHKGQWQDVSVKVLFLSSVVGVVLLSLKNIFLVIYSWKLYVNTLQNYFELLLLIASITYFALTNPNKPNDEGQLTEPMIHVGAVVLFAAWVNFTLLLGKLPSAGIYINMIVGVSRELLKFLLLYASSIVAFALCFHIISGEDNEHFADPLTSTMCMLAMMVGEFNFGDLFVRDKVRYHGTTQLMFVLFLLFVSIIIMNLLVGLAISNITAQFQSAGVYRLRMTVLLIRMLDDVLMTVQNVAPFCLKRSQLFPYIRSKQNLNKDDYKEDNLSRTGDEKNVDFYVYVYPNSQLYSHHVYVRDFSTGGLKRTTLELAPWIIVNAFKLLRAEHEASRNTLEAESVRRRHDERLGKLAVDISSLKKDIQAIASYVKRQ